MQSFCCHYSACLLEMPAPTHVAGIIGQVMMISTFQALAERRNQGFSPDAAALQRHGVIPAMCKVAQCLAL